MEMRPFGRLLSVETAQRRILAAARPVNRTERVPLDQALGRVAGRTVRARAPVPSFPRATWDGYALRSTDTRSSTDQRPASLRIVGEVYAEGGYSRLLRRGEAVAIATGGAVPAGADAVIIFEETQVRGSALSVPRRVRPGERIAEPGEDFPKGFPLTRKGAVLAAADLGALASVGLRETTVFQRPKVTIIPNGNELVLPGKPLARGKIYESNNLTLGAVIRSAGGDGKGTPPVIDDPRAIEQAVRDALPASDLVVLTGGSSVGERDFLPEVLPRVGALLFHGLAVRPGKPTLAVRVGRKLVIGMPGHPTSCLANGFWLLLPLIRKLAHLPGPGWIPESAELAEDYLPPSPSLSTVIPLRLEGHRGYPTFHDSSAITSLTGANAFVIVPPSTRLRKGTRLIANRVLPPVVPP
jgi:molybdopterin molybdotransferase